MHTETVKICRFIILVVDLFNETNVQNDGVKWFTARAYQTHTHMKLQYTRFLLTEVWQRGKRN